MWSEKADSMTFAHPLLAPSPRGRPGALTCAGVCESRAGWCVVASSRLALGYWTTGDSPPLFTWTVGALLSFTLPSHLALRDLGGILC